MKRSLTLLTGFLFIVCALHAQKPSKYFIEIKGGASFPIGQFAEKAYPQQGALEQNQPGLAQVGTAASITGGYYLKENVGIFLSLANTTNKQKEQVYADWIKDNWSNPEMTFSDKTTSWNIYSIMAGGFFVNSLVEEKLNLVTKLGAGICFPRVPGFSWQALRPMSSSVPGASGEVGKEKVSATFCYQVSIGLQYKLTNRLNLLFDINSFNATAKKDYGPNVLTPFPGNTSDRKWKISTVNALAGIGFNL